MAETVRLIANIGNPTPLTGTQVAELERLSALPDTAIDMSDIPPLDERFCSNADLFPDLALHRPTKHSMTVRLDADARQ